MTSRIKIPPIPTNNVRFEEGLLKFEILSGCAYASRLNDTGNGGFVGGHWTKSKFTTDDGSPAWIRLDGSELVVAKLINCLVEKETGNYVGGEVVEIARLKICE